MRALLPRIAFLDKRQFLKPASKTRLVVDACSSVEAATEAESQVEIWNEFIAEHDLELS